jgi:type II secretory pathway component GspD/PulD (secretin)
MALAAGQDTPARSAAINVQPAPSAEPADAPQPEAGPVPGATAVPAGSAGGAAAPAETETGIDERFLKAVLESQAAEMTQGRQRISYPDDLPGAALIRSAQKPGEVTLFYPLRIAGGVTVEVAKDHTVKLIPANKASVDPILETLTRYLDTSKEKATWYAPRNMLEINLLEENMPFILDLLNFLDAPDRQIIIEAAVWEVSKAQDTQLGATVKSERRSGGATFFKMFNSRFDTQAFIDTLTSTQPYQGGTLEFVTAADAHYAKMEVVLQFLRNWGYADIVSRPRMRVSVGQTARILTGEQVPIQSVKLLSEQLEIGAQTTYRDVGIQLYVTPTIATADAITLAVLSIVSEITGYTDPGPQGISNPIIATREAQTEVTVANEELITVGGLDYTKRLVKESKIPLLGDIPLIGLLFKSKRETYKEVQLWFTVKPTIADTRDRLILPELTGNPPGKGPQWPLPK